MGIISLGDECWGGDSVDGGNSGIRGEGGKGMMDRRGEWKEERSALL